MTARPARIDTPDAFAAAFDVSRETVERLEIYESLLRRWQKAVNLVSPATIGEVWHRHFADSAQLAGLAPEAENWLDLGTGGGFPGMVVAIVLANRPGTGVHLIESNARKCAFLNDVARETGTSVQIHESRIEQAAPGVAGVAFDVVTSRGLAPLPELLDRAGPFFSRDTRGLFLKGARAADEVAQARERIQFAEVLHRSRTDAAGRIVEISGLNGENSP